MKTSIFLCSYGPLYERGADTRQLIDLAARQGFGAVEPFPCDDLATVEDARGIGEYARERGLEISCFSTVCALLGPDGDEEVRRMRQRIDMAAAMGSPYFHHTIHPPLTLPRRGDPSLLQALERAVPVLQDLCRYARDRGVLCVYEDQGLYFNGCDGFGRLCDALGDTPFGVVADVGNILFVDQTAEEFLGRFSSRIVHVHLKDYLKKPGSAPCPGRGWYVTRAGSYLRDTVIGHGVVDFPAIFRVLDQMGYDGWYSLEYAAMEPVEAGVPISLENIRRFREDVLRNPVQLPLLDGISPRFV